MGADEGVEGEVWWHQPIQQMLPLGPLDALL